MRRRRLITALGGAALWPLAGHAQQAERMRRVGALYFFAQNDANSQAFATAFTQALGRLGWVAGKNIRIDSRFAAGDLALFKQYAAQLVSLAPDAILASTGPAAFAVREQTRTIPVVFVIVPDPVALGLVRSVARAATSPASAPMTHRSWEMAALLKEVAPRVTRVAVIFNPKTGSSGPVAQPRDRSRCPVPWGDGSARSGTRRCGDRGSDRQLSARACSGQWRPASRLRLEPTPTGMVTRVTQWKSRVSSRQD